MRIINLLFIVSTGLIASAQTPSQDSRNIPQTPPATNYLLTPPNVALPGSGVATGQPLRNDVNVNDARNPQGGAVFQPAAGSAAVADTYRLSTPITSVEGNSQAGLAMTESSEPVTGDGIRNFSTGTPGSMANAKSLGDIASELRGNKPGIGKRAFDNSDIAALSGNTVGNQAVELPQSDASGATPSGSVASGPYTTPSGEQVLDRRDYAAVEAALARHAEQAEQQASEQGSETLMAENQQPETPQQDTSDEAAAEPAEEPVPAEQQTEESAETLPQTSSTLPLFALLGIGAVTFGMVFRNARRSF